MNFEQEIKKLCNKLDIPFDYQSKGNMENVNTSAYFNPRLQNAINVKSIPSTLQVDPLTLPFIR